MQQNAVNFNLSWNNHENYWICVVSPESEELQALDKDGLGGIYLDKSCYAVSAPREWKEIWDQLHDAINKNNLINPRIAIIPGAKTRPNVTEVMPYLESADKIDSIAKNLWLGDAILNNRVEIHFQPVVDRSKEPFGYEGFARVIHENGDMVSGGLIFQAAKEINIQHLLDKHLQILAIKTFAEAKLPGSLFINFLTGFIQVPGKYLEGLSEATRHYNLPAKRLALDVSESQNVQNIDQITSIISFASSKGYSVSLDDITSVESLKAILAKSNLKPDFIKLERKLTHDYQHPSSTREIMAICEAGHAKGSLIVAEAIETEGAYKTLMNCGVDLFQGYYFSAPMHVDKIKKGR